MTCTAPLPAATRPTAPGDPALVAGRAVQGIGAALLMPATLAVIARTFPERSSRRCSAASSARPR